MPGSAVSSTMKRRGEERDGRQEGVRNWEWTKGSRERCGKKVREGGKDERVREGRKGAEARDSSVARP